jgi:catechol 2,3-dioxygenase-like lactoylglutathione lyase family enzyme
MPTSPIENRIGCIFIPVSDIPRAIDWYSRLLGLPIDKTTHGGLIYNVPISGDLGLILDGHKPVTNSSQPLFFFWTADIRQAYTFLLENHIPLERAIEDIGSVTTLTFKDLDNNLLMVCQRNS